MRRLSRRLFQLSRSEFLLLPESLILVVAVRAGLCMWPYDRVRRYLSRESRVSKNKPSPTEIVRLISAVDRRLPGGSCLTRALAVETLLRRHGYDACLRIGVSKNAPSDLQAHAWVESNGEVVIGGDEVDGLTPLQAGGAQPSR